MERNNTTTTKKINFLKIADIDMQNLTFFFTSGCDNFQILAAGR